MITAIPELVQLGLSVFTTVWNLFHHQAVPTTAAPAITAHLTSTPGATAAHQAVMTSAVNLAANVAQTNSTTGA